MTDESTKSHKINTFVLFIASARSGHSFIASALDAHPNVCMGHELNVLKKYKDGLLENKESLFRWMFNETQKFNKNGRLTPNRFGPKYDQAIPGQIKNSMDNIIITGNKNGQTDTSKYLDVIDRFQEFINPVKIRFLVVLRHPLDASIRPRIYRMLQERYNDLRYPKHVIYYEDFIARPAAELKKILVFLNLTPYGRYIENVSRKTFKYPRRSRKLLYNPSMTHKYKQLKKICKTVPLFKRYAEDLKDEWQ